MKLKDSAVIRPATRADLRFMKIVEQETPNAAHWNNQQYEDLFREDAGRAKGAEKLAAKLERLVLIAEDFKSATQLNPVHVFLGFLVARHLAPEWELENIIIAPAALRQGVGTRLLEALFACAHETNSEAVFLEVRESNVAARSLYASAGFVQTGHRKAYYTSLDEDAILYRWSAEKP